MTSRSRGQMLTLTLLGALVVGVTAGCGGADPDDTKAASSAATPAAEPTAQAAEPTATEEPDESGPTTETVTMTDPVEDAFTVDVPTGWDSVAYSTGQFDVHREVVNSVSPDGATVLFLGDPKFPNYWNPDTANPVTVQFAEELDYMELQRYTPADDYFSDYAEEKFGALPQFKVASIKPDAALIKAIQQEFANAGLDAPEAHAVNVRFDYDADGTPMHGMLVGVTINSGSFWQADVSGLSTDRTVEEYLPMLTAMSRSKKTNPEFIQRSNANHEQTMAQIQSATEAMTQRHNANMAAIQSSAERHQTRMQAISAAGDASIQRFNDRMASGDATQRGFLNYINDENTVANSSGQSFQVDDGYDRYFMNKNDSTYLGGDVNFGDTSIRELGLNPSDYEEVRIKK